MTLNRFMFNSVGFWSHEGLKSWTPAAAATHQQRTILYLCILDVRFSVECFVSQRWTSGSGFTLMIQVSMWKNKYTNTPWEDINPPFTHQHWLYRSYNVNVTHTGMGLTPKGVFRLSVSMAGHREEWLHLKLFPQGLLRMEHTIIVCVCVASISGSICPCTTP